MSKFEHCSFRDGYDDYAVSKEKFSLERAIEIYKHETGAGDVPMTSVAVTSAFVRHRAGINEDGEPSVGWWLEYRNHGRNCPVWAFHTTRTTDDECFKGYEYHQIS